MILKDVLEQFSLSEESREALISGSLDAPREFKTVAAAILSGCFVVRQLGGEKKTIRVYPTCVEIYYHEEGHKITDPIVYHRNRKTKTTEKNYEVFLLGKLHNHVSGIDITFEKEEEKGTGKNDEKGIVRASALIREFRIEGHEEVEERSTYLYEALYSQFSIFDGGFSVVWEDGTEKEVDNGSPRKNVAAFDAKNDDFVKRPKEQPAKGFVPDERKWQFRLKNEE